MIDPLGLCSTSTNISYCAAGGVDGIGDKDSEFVNHIIGNTRVVTCTYACTDSNGETADYRGTHDEYYFTTWDDGREGQCQGAIYDDGNFNYNYNRLIFSRTRFGHFNLENVDFQSFQRTEENSCNECND